MIKGKAKIELRQICENWMDETSDVVWRYIIHLPYTNSALVSLMNFNTRQGARAAAIREATKYGLQFKFLPDTLHSNIEIII